MQNIINIIVFILVFGFIIFIHELGHFVAAKYFGVYCSQFSIGMGPKLLSKKIGETNYELRALPIGGFVAMAGEVEQENNEEMKDIPLERTLPGISAWKRIIVYLAGVFMNFLSAFIVVVIVYSLSYSVPSNNSIIGSVGDHSPAMMAGLQENDTINKITIDSTGKEYLIGSFNDLTNALEKESNVDHNDTLGMEVYFTRDNQQHSVHIDAIYESDLGKYIIGITPEHRKMNFVESLQSTVDYFKITTMQIFDTLGKLITNSKETLSQLSGPVGIYDVTAKITESGNISAIFMLFALLGINVGIFNLLPIPGLDGSQVLFTLIEKIIGKEIPIKVRYGLQLAGFGILILLMIIVTFNDLFRIF